MSEVFRRAGLGKERLNAAQARVVQAILACRTPKCGKYLRECTNCGEEEQGYNSCWNRHCPKCQGGSSFRWVERRSEELLDVPYFHVVFTFPSELRELCYQNKRLLYDVLFESSSEAMQDSAERRLGVSIGSFSVLHSWNQQLQYHPHAHHVVPACGFDEHGDPKRFPGNQRFFLPTRVLSRLFRGKAIARIKKLYYADKLHLKGNLEYLKDPKAFEQFLNKSVRSDWVVYAKRPFGGPQAVIRYLASYIHRVGISSKRIRDLSTDSVTFLARDRKHPAKKRLVTLPPKVFCHRFLLHLFPKRFRRVRYFGFLRNAAKSELLQKLRHALGSPPIPAANVLHACKKCSNGLMTLRLLFKPHSGRPIRLFPPVPILSSA